MTAIERVTGLGSCAAANVPLARRPALSPDSARDRCCPSRPAKNLNEKSPAHKGLPLFRWSG